MKSLLDTCIILWAAREPHQLSARVRDLLLGLGEELVLSVVSGCEIALKPQLGIVDAAGWVRQAARNLQASILPVRLDHIAALQKLPPRHRDPFDRLLIARGAPANSRWLRPRRPFEVIGRCVVCGNETAPQTKQGS